MTDIIISRLEKRLRKVETKVIDMKDHYEEMDNNLEDLYDTINNNNNTNNNTYNLKSLNKNDTCPDTTCPDTILNNK
jgi:deoxyadenosine/deoxycytidine kinase